MKKLVKESLNESLNEVSSKSDKVYTIECINSGEYTGIDLQDIIIKPELYPN